MNYNHQVKGGRNGVKGLTGQTDHPDDNHFENGQVGHNHHLKHEHDPNDPEVWSWEWECCCALKIHGTKVLCGAISEDHRLLATGANGGEGTSDPLVSIERRVAK